jgi:ABC-2 type transport system permease protein
MAGRSLVRPVTILLSSLFVAGFAFSVSYAGLRVMVQVFQLSVDEQIGGMLLGTLFFTLGAALVFSTGLVLHGGLFNTPETAFLLSKPVRADQVFAYKFQSAVAFSSWAFLLLGGPVLIAYGMVAGAPWYFYLLLPVYFLGFVLLPGSAGALLVLLIVNYVPRRRKQFLVLLVLALLFGAGWYVYAAVVQGRLIRQSPEQPREVANVLLDRIAFTRGQLLPSAWVARGLQAAGAGDLAAAGYYLALLWGNGLFFYLLASWAAARLYRRGLNRLTTGGDLRRRHGGLWMDRVMAALLPFVHPGTRLLIVKDFRTFRRDPQQWAQVLIFVGLLVLYFTNIRRLFVSDVKWSFQSSISLLNLGAIALLLCTYTGRFIYPLLSLEGRKFWVLGLLPLRRSQLLWGKFAFSLLGGLSLAVTMVLLSDLMLGMPWDAVVVHALTVVVLAAGLSGISVGLGAVMPNFKESDPSKIAVGVGGTLNLVAGLAFLIVTIVVMSGPWHAFRTFRPPGTEAHPLMIPAVLLSLAVGLIGGALAVLLPLRAGIDALERMEF